MLYNITWEKQGLVLQHYGIVTAEDFAVSVNEIYSDSRIDNINYMIFDASTLDQLLLNENEVMKIAGVDKGASYYVLNIKLALVAHDENVLKLFNQYIEASRRLDSHWEVNVFDNVEDARSWASS